jgi:hypothetical protein
MVRPAAMYAFVPSLVNPVGSAIEAGSRSWSATTTTFGIALGSMCSSCAVPLLSTYSSLSTRNNWSFEQPGMATSKRGGARHIPFASTAQPAGVVAMPPAPALLPSAPPSFVPVPPLIELVPPVVVLAPPSPALPFPPWLGPAPPLPDLDVAPLPAWLDPAADGSPPVGLSTRSQANAPQTLTTHPQLHARDLVLTASECPPLAHAVGLPQLAGARLRLRAYGLPPRPCSPCGLRAAGEDSGCAVGALAQGASACAASWRARSALAPLEARPRQLGSPASLETACDLHAAEEGHERYQVTKRLSRVIVE